MTATFGVDDLAFVLGSLLEFVLAEVLGLLGMLAAIGMRLLGGHHYLVQVSCVV
ncbi:hypothetical protein H7K45_04780 [Mycobacterium yunnanensis]|uniref:Uncharacterized protein n=1 Tax=Mycobacterium yunnanensis TaxID=368477 RepID=A0A9X2YI85_9MYCO|nr:hypothetical protein [Mycobacterium yunnanensis]MCV7419848.1 hypothetical protein [Mycobacterium yunnanensis]